MRTIGAKELRLQLDQVFDRVLAGEEVIINHRFKGQVKLSPLHSAAPDARQKLAGLKVFDAAAKRSSPFDTTVPLKQLYDQSLTDSYGNQHDLS